MSKDGLLQTSFKLMFLKLRNSYLDVYMPSFYCITTLANYLTGHSYLTSWNSYFCNILHCHTCRLSSISSVDNQRMYLHIIFTAIALPSFAGQLSKQITLGVILYFTKLLGEVFVAKHIPLSDELISAGDKKLFCQMTSNKHCLHSLLPEKRHAKALNSLRSHGYKLPHIESNLFINSFRNRCLFSYTLCLKKNVLTLKRYSSKLQEAILMKFGRNIQNTLE